MLEQQLKLLEKLIVKCVKRDYNAISDALDMKRDYLNKEQFFDYIRKEIFKITDELEQTIFHTKNIFSFDEASKFLNLSKSYLYKLTSGNLIPHYKPQGKMLYFEKEELEAWVMS